MSNLIIMLQIPVCMYHGTPAERAELRRTVMRLDESYGDDKGNDDTKDNNDNEEDEGHDEDYKEEDDEEADNEEGDRDRSSVHGSDTESDDSDTEHSTNKFPIVLTTYEMIIRDRSHLARYDWGYIVVDEGHRLKNLDCRLMKEIKRYPSAGRMILTGTPLHVRCGSFLFVFFRC